MSIGCLLIKNRDTWRLLCINSTGEVQTQTIGDCNVDELAQQVRQLTATWNVKQRVIVAPDAASAYFAALDSDAVAGIRDRKTLTFEMEGSLPIDAESAVADFAEEDGCVTGVAIEVERWAPLVDALDDAGVLVEAVSPWPILATAALVAEDKATDGDLVVWNHDGETDLLLVGTRNLRGWRHVFDNGIRLQQELAAIQSANDPDIRILSFADTSIDDDSLADATGLGSPTIEPMDQVALRGASLVLQGRDTPWYDLRRGRLAEKDPLRMYRGSLRGLLVSAVVLLVVAIAASYWRQSVFQAEIARVQQQQRELFEEAFPDARVPAALLSRFRSEHRKALASRSTGGNVPTPQSALRVLDSFLSGLPADVRFRITQVAVTDGELRVDVQLRNHDSAGKLAAALERVGFSMLPPGTEQIDATTVASQLQGEFLPTVTTDNTDGRTPDSKVDQRGSS
ncbi:MAG: hypothetical protein HKN47_17355 [Pirellulaceae bacterium]|nr:hypothetical protein [Pirellulaceae bacterium]